MNKELLEYFNGDDLAASVFLSKYAAENEQFPYEMHERLAKEFNRMHEQTYDKDKWKEHYDKLSKTGQRFYARVDHYGENFFFGLFDYFYNIVPQGSVMANLGTSVIGSLSNCFVVGQPHDSYGGIMQKDEELAQLMKRRGGVGIDISSLRPSGTPTTNSAKTSTGAASFMHRYSNTTREVAQNGRRGALMITIDCRHPDVFDFVNMKKDRTKVTGANISVMLRDDFMQAVENDEDYVLRWPCNLEVPKDTRPFEYNTLYPFQNKTNIGGYYKIIKAKEVYEQIVENAWEHAEPGQIFIDRHWNYSPDGAYREYRGITTNPCGEIFMQTYDACRLILANLLSLALANVPRDKFDILAYELFYSLQYLADLLIDLEAEAITKIINKIKQDEYNEVELRLWENIYQTAISSRRSGSGITALGDMLALMGYKYDSEESKAFIENLMRIKMRAELDCMVDLAILKGPFKGWDFEAEFISERTGQTFIDTGQLMVGESNIRGTNEFYQMLLDEFPDETARMMKYGRRNVSWSTVAPAGTVSLMTQTTSGIEPLFSPYYFRRKKINPSDKNNRVDFVDKNGDQWQEFPVLHPQFKLWIQKQDPSANIENFTKEDVQEWFEKSPWFGSTANEINWLARVEIQAIVQKYTSHSISSTINLPNTVSKEEVGQIYMHAWKNKLKGVTVYRDGSRDGVLINEPKQLEFAYHDAPKRPKQLDAESHITTVQGQKYNVIVGLMNGNPYEVFVLPGEHFKRGSGKIEKEARGKYTYVSDTVHSIDFAHIMSDEQEAVARLVSTALRHGADIKFIVEQLNKTKGGITSFSKAIARCLKKYIPDGAASTVICDNCGSEHVVFENGCQMCRDCGESKC